MEINIGQMISYLSQLIEEIGYIGIFIGMFIESTIFPLPSEVVMIPAGIAVFQGNKDFLLVILFATSGNLSGAIFSYYLASSLGRAIIFKIGKYFFVKPASINRVENFFHKHGNISVFISRLLPGFRHFISIPAGIAKMKISYFIFFTFFGSLIWNVILTIIGIKIAENKNFFEQNSHLITLSTLVFCSILLIIYFFFKRNLAKKSV
jgi:membrane protein DedA with SNARE-associated domain